MKNQLWKTIYHISIKDLRSKERTEAKTLKSVPRKRCSENMQQMYRRTIPCLTILGGIEMEHWVKIG